MASTDLIIEWYFPDSTVHDDDEIHSFKEEHWDSTGCGWISQRSEKVAKEVIELSIRDGSAAAKEALQVALNDVVAGDLTFLKEDGNVGPVTLARMELILRNVRDSEQEICEILEDF